MFKNLFFFGIHFSRTFSFMCFETPDLLFMEFGSSFVHWWWNRGHVYKKLHHINLPTNRWNTLIPSCIQKSLLKIPWKLSTQARSPRYREKLPHEPYPADPEVPQSFSAQAWYWTSPGTTKRFHKNQVPQVPHVPWKFSTQARPVQDKISPPLGRGVKPWF